MEMGMRARNNGLRIAVRSLLRTIDFMLFNLKCIVDGGVENYSGASPMIAGAALPSC